MKNLLILLFFRRCEVFVVVATFRFAGFPGFFHGLLVSAKRKNWDSEAIGEGVERGVLGAGAYRESVCWLDGTSINMTFKSLCLCPLRLTTCLNFNGKQWCWYNVESLQRGNDMVEAKLKAKSFNSTVDSWFALVGSRPHGVASNQVISWSTDHPYPLNADDGDLRWKSNPNFWQIFRLMTWSRAKRLTEDNKKNPEYHVVAAIKKQLQRTDKNCTAEKSWPNHVKTEQHMDLKRPKVLIKNNLLRVNCLRCQYVPKYLSGSCHWDSRSRWRRMPKPRLIQVRTNFF